jgi:hypothetical protein
MNSPITTTLLVQQDRLATTRLQTHDDPTLAPGQVRVRVDRFALTANNITYAAMGEMLNYWKFFPSGAAGWGIVPVWGFASVVESTHGDLPVGERLYGYWPMASHAVLTPSRVSTTGFADGAPHRAELHPIYNQYLRSAADAFYSADTEDLQALLRPLFITSWLIDDFLADQSFFGARRLLLSSASSKTAYGTAFQLAQRDGLEVVGLTSPGNVAFCESLGCYRSVLTYGDIEAKLDGAGPSVYIDFAGSVSLRQRIHAHASELTYSCSVGASHVQDLGGVGALPGPRPVMFFAPAQAKKRATEWGGQEFNNRLVAAWERLTAQVQSGQSGAPDDSSHASDGAVGNKPWIEVHQHEGPAATQALFERLLGGTGDPRAGHIASMQLA